MQGLMMNRPLLIADILTYGVETFPEQELVSMTVEGGKHCASFAETARRIAQLAHGLAKLGIEHGDRIATLAWNGYRHFELYFAISCSGAVCHTLNPRLPADQLIYITNHAEDKVLFLDLTFVPLIEELADKLPPDMRYVIMTDCNHMPATKLANVLCYEELLAGEPERYDWPEFDENTAATLCYTSGTTGKPKGALYTHRSICLHTLIVAATLAEGFEAGSRILPVVPLFHANAWGLPYIALFKGVSLVFPGANLDGKSVYDLLEAEEVFSAWGVPTVWMGLLEEIKQRGRIPKGLSQMTVGGSAAARALIEAFENYGVNVHHAWGMTEMSPVGTQGGLPLAHRNAPFDKQIDIKCKQGRRIFGVELKLIGENGERVPHDGQAAGELFVRGNTIVSGYYNNADASAAAMDDEGWFSTGDIATIDAQGILTITDRAKDLIKSGGEWISSLDLENIIMSHKAVANCAVIAIPDAKWDERPLLIVQPVAGETPAAGELLGHLAQHVAKWQIPDDVAFVEQLPLTATGKVSKLTLREKFKNHQPQTTG